MQKISRKIEKVKNQHKVSKESNGLTFIFLHDKKIFFIFNKTKKINIPIAGQSQKRTNLIFNSSKDQAEWGIRFILLKNITGEYIIADVSPKVRINKPIFRQEIPFPHIKNMSGRDIKKDI